jgi:putative addiction module component (TIGR02574 family)
MTTRAADILQSALSLTDSERADLAARLIDSLDGDEASAQAEWDREIEYRLAQIDGGQVRSVPWDEARRQIERQES